MNSYEIIYFAQLREQRGLSNEKIDSNCKNLLELYDELKIKYKFGLFADDIKFAVNDELVDKNRELNFKIKPGDKIVFIPPVAGG